MEENKKIEYGVDHKDDTSLYKSVNYRQRYIDKFGNVDKKEATLTRVRNRIIDLSIPEGQEGRITYTDCQTIE